MIKNEERRLDESNGAAMHAIFTFIDLSLLRGGRVFFALGGRVGIEILVLALEVECDEVSLKFSLTFNLSPSLKWAAVF